MACISSGKDVDKLNLLRHWEGLCWANKHWLVHEILSCVVQWTDFIPGGTIWQPSQWSLYCELNGWQMSALLMGWIVFFVSVLCWPWLCVYVAAVTTQAPTDTGRMVTQQMHFEMFWVSRWYSGHRFTLSLNDTAVIFRMFQDAFLTIM